MNVRVEIERRVVALPRVRVFIAGHHHAGLVGQAIQMLPYCHPQFRPVVSAERQYVLADFRARNVAALDDVARDLGDNIQALEAFGDWVQRLPVETLEE